MKIPFTKKARLPQLSTRERLVEMLKTSARLQKEINKLVAKGDQTENPNKLRQYTMQARQLVQEMSRNTYNVQQLQMQLERELLGDLSQGTLPQWGPPVYFYAAELRQWAKSRTTPAGTFLFEAVTADGQGVLAELPEFRLLDLWQPSTDAEYDAQVQRLLDAGGITWNQAPAPELPQP